MRTRRDSRQVKIRRAMALDRTELRHDGFIRCADRLPADDQWVTCRAEDASGLYLLPFPVVRRAGEWFNARYGNKLCARMVAWRSAPKEDHR